MQYIKCLVGFYLVPKSDEASDNISNESSNGNEDEESDEMSMYFCTVWTRYCSFACSIAALQLVYHQEIVAPYSYKLPFQLVSFVILILIVVS